MKSDTTANNSNLDYTKILDAVSQWVDAHIEDFKWSPDEQSDEE